MPEPIEEFYISIGSDISKMLSETRSGLNKVEDRLNQTEKKGTRAFKNIGQIVKKTAGLITAIAGAIAGVVISVNKLTEAYIKQQRADAQLTATLRSTGGAAGYTTAELKKMAAELQNVTNFGDETIEGAQAMLATFTSVGRDTFPRATKAILDLTTAMYGSKASGEQLRTTTIQIGKALNDPVKGVANLRRVGIQLTQAQEDQIKTFVDSGKAMQAQNIILGELERQFGGSAKAAREADQGFEASLNKIGDLQEKIGGELIPLRQGYVSFLELLAGKSDETSGIVTSALAGIAAVAGTVVISVKALVESAVAEFNVLSAAAKAALNFENPIAAAQKASEVAAETLSRNAKILGNIPGIISEAYINIKKGWEDQRKAAEKAAAEGAAGIAPPPEIVEGASDEVKKILQDAGRDFIDLQAETNDKLAENQKEHEQNLADIEAEGTKKRLEINQKYDKELADGQADIFKNAREDLSRLEDETDRKLAKRRKSANKEESRETEDHLIDMRRLRLSFLDNLEDAIKNRDAGRVLDLQRQFQRESQERQQDFEKKRSRERSDTQDSLAQLASDEQRRAQEIIDHRTQALADLETRVKEERQRELSDLDEKLATEREKENTRYDERQTELENALQKRLETLAKSLADTENLEADSAQKILETLNETFGVGGNIDKLMKDFAKRRSQTLVVQVGFEERVKEARRRKEGGGASAGFGSTPGSITSFQHGGSLIARKPTLAQFGETPELVQFTPLSQLGNRGGGQKMEIELKLSGSAPPGIRSADRDAIANVMVNALIEAGINAKPGR